MYQGSFDHKLYALNASTGAPLWSYTTGGANQALRPVHFHDVEDDATGWLTTKDLAQPQGWAFRQLGPTWAAFREQLQQLLQGRPDAGGVVPYLYEAHDLEAIVPLVEAAERDSTTQLGRRLFEHLARQWSWYAGFADVQVALVASDKWPNARNKPQRALAEELTVAGAPSRSSARVH